MDNQQTPTAGTPIYQESGEKNAKWLWFLIILIIVGALVFAFFRGIGPFARLKGGSQVTVTPTPIAFSSPSPLVLESTPGATVDKSEPAIRVLNGSGRVGLAAVVKNLLEGKGWKVSAIGNAPTYDYEKTFVRSKSAFGKFVQTIIADLSDDYSVSVSTDLLEATDSADIEVIVGAK